MRIGTYFRRPTGVIRIAAYLVDLFRPAPKKMERVRLQHLRDLGFSYFIFLIFIHLRLAVLGPASLVCIFGILLVHANCVSVLHKVQGLSTVLCLAS